MKCALGGVTMRLMPGLVAIALAAYSAPAHAGEELLFGAAPEWVVAVPDGEPVALSDDLHVHIHLTDFQSRLDADRQAIYTALEMEFRTPQGLSAGNLSLPWRPEFDELTIHHVRIRRDDELIDVLEEGQTFTVLRREENLEMATLTGVLTANMFPAGLEVGDTLEIAYTMTQQNPVLAGNPEIALGPLNGIVGQTHVRFSWPEDMEVDLATTRGLPEIERGERNDYEYASFTMSGGEPLVTPASAPVRYQLVRMIEASAFDSWGELAQLFVPLYADASQIAAEGPLRRELEAIRSASSDPVRQAELALTLVQDKVRYVALAMGAGGLVPADTATTWSRRFGDCKAKTALLLGILHELGIEAEPILVHSLLGDALPGRLPQVGAFDHVLVRTHIGGRTYFLDGTGIGDTSLERLQVPGYSWGLLVISEGAALVPMVAAPLAMPDEDTTVRFDVSGGLRAPAPTQLEVVFRGPTAIGTNSIMANYIGQSRVQALEQFWRERYDFVMPDQVDMQFDEASGELRFTLVGTAQLDWDNSSYEPLGMRVGYIPDFTRVPGPDDDAPFSVPHPFFNRTTHIVTLPDGFTSEQVDGEDVEQSVAGLEYRRSLQIEGNVFTASRSTRSLAPEFAASEVAEADGLLRRLREKRVFLRIPSGYRLSQDEVASMAQADSEDPDELVAQGNALLDAGEWAAARGVLDKAIEIAPGNEWASANRAIALANLGAYGEARADIARTLELDPENYVAFHASGIIAMRQLDYPTAIAAFTRAIDAKENNSYAISQRAGAYASLGDFEAALVDARTLQRTEPDVMYSYLFEGRLLAELGDEQGVVDTVARMIELFPDDPGILPAASQLYSEAGMEDQAAGLLTQSISDGPNAVALFTRAMQAAETEVAQRLADLDQALAIQPDYVPALHLRAQIHWREYNLDLALADANRIIEIAPTLPGGYDTKMMILLDQEDEHGALALADNMVERFPGNPLLMRAAAGYYRELGQYDRSDRVRAMAEELLSDEDLQHAYDAMRENQ